MRRTGLAFKNLLDRPARTVVSSIGVGFAILLMFMQLGFLSAVGDTATRVYSRLSCDLIVRSPEYLQVFDPRSVPRPLMASIAAVSTVQDVRMIDLGVSGWRNPITGELRPVAMIGIDPDRPALSIAGLKQFAPLLRRSDQVLVDDATRADYGPANGIRFSPDDLGLKTEVTQREVTVAGLYRMGTGLAANAAILMSHEGFNRLAAERLASLEATDHVSMILVTLRPGSSLEQSMAEIKERLARMDGRASTYKVLTVAEAIDEERWHWYARTPIGVIFAIGVALSVIVGGVICYMILAADVMARLPEYATLKAIGYSNRYLMRVVLGQAAWLAALAYPPAAVSALLLYWMTFILSGIEITMTLPRLLLVAGLSLLMCSTAGWLALRKMTKAEPANLF